MNEADIIQREIDRLTFRMDRARLRAGRNRRIADSMTREAHLAEVGREALLVVLEKLRESTPDVPSDLGTDAVLRAIEEQEDAEND